MSETIGQNKIEFKERKRWVFLGLPFTFTVYRIDEEIINVRKGFLNTKEDDCYMYKVTDVELETSLGERIFGLGTVVCFTGDTTDQQLRITHVKNFFYCNERIWHIVCCKSIIVFSRCNN